MTVTRRLRAMQLLLSEDHQQREASMVKIMRFVATLIVLISLLIELLASK